MSSLNPVLTTAELAYKLTSLVQVDDNAVKHAAKHLHRRIGSDAYTPRTWRTHPLHILPTDPYDPEDPRNKLVLDWIFLISALNFSFWSEKEGRSDRYGVHWKVGWDSDETTVHTGYWSLVAALDRAIEDNISITDPNFYSSEELCPDAAIEHIFRPAEQCTENIPLLDERIAVMREVGAILCNRFQGSFKGFLDAFQQKYQGNGTTLDLVKMVTETFPCFRDQLEYCGNEVFIWKRPQILVAETWAAFYPESAEAPHPLFPGPKGADIRQLTMFADYRVPQILHHLRILTYPESLLKILDAHTPLEPGSREELSLRTSSIVAVERVKNEILRLIEEEKRGAAEAAERSGMVCSVLIDMYLWDLAKRIEKGEEKIDGIETAEIVPIHRTRSIWY